MPPVQIKSLVWFPAKNLTGERPPLIARAGLGSKGEPKWPGKHRNRRSVGRNGNQHVYVRDPQVSGAARLSSRAPSAMRGFPVGFVSLSPLPPRRSFGISPRRGRGSHEAIGEVDVTDHRPDRPRRRSRSRSRIFGPSQKAARRALRSFTELNLGDAEIGGRLNSRASSPEYFFAR